MNTKIRIFQVWAVLSYAAAAKTTVVYEDLASAFGGTAVGVGPILLGPIQDYCRTNKLPPLTGLVVQKNTNLPGTGFAGKMEHWHQGRVRVYGHNWKKEHKAFAEYVWEQL